MAHYDGGSIYRYSASGVDLGLFATIGGNGTDFIAFDAAGHLYVSDFMGGFIGRVSPTRQNLGHFVTGVPGAEGIAFDASGNLYLASDSGWGGSDKITKYSPTSMDLGTFALGS